MSRIACMTLLVAALGCGGSVDDDDPDAADAEGSDTTDEVEDHGDWQLGDGDGQEIRDGRPEEGSEPDAVEPEADVGPCPAGEPCDDGNPCTVGDACADGRCVPGPGAGGWYPDADGDGFGDAHATPVCTATAPPGTVADSSDCCDSVADARPDQTAWFAADYTCGAGPTFDYDCSGTEEPRWAEHGECRREAGGTCTSILGWQGATTPVCGAGRAFVTGCDATCRATTEARTQECR